MPKKQQKRKKASSRGAAAGSKRRRARPAAGRRFVAASTISRSTLTIPFDSHRQLVERLQQLVRALETPLAPTGADAAVMASAAAAGECMDIVTATEVIVAALQDNPFEPQTKLGTVYLSEVERDLFRDRVKSEVEARGCAIGLGDIPNGAGTKEVETRNAVQKSAH